MSERVFLEDVGKLYSVNALGDARAWEVRHLRHDRTIPPLIYVVESEVGQSFLLGREVCGRAKFNIIRTIAKSFVELFFEQLKTNDLSQYLILRGAYPFDLQYAMGYAPPYDTKLLPTGWIKLQRVLNSEGTDWEIKAQNLIGEYQGNVWLIPDTAIASGSTLAFFLRNGFAHHRPKQVYVFTACGSLEGIQRIYQECQKKGVELIPVFSQCIFEVSRKGNLPGLPLTDLSVMSPGSITTKALYEKALTRYQRTRMCCVGDIGESLEDPIQYSLHTLWEMQVLEMDPDKENWDAWSVNVREKSFKEKVSNFKPELIEYFHDLWK
jgi:hypothetical protein